MKWGCVVLVLFALAACKRKEADDSAKADEAKVETPATATAEAPPPAASSATAQPGGASVKGGSAGVSRTGEGVAVSGKDGTVTAGKEGVTVQSPSGSSERVVNVTPSSVAIGAGKAPGVTVEQDKQGGKVKVNVGGVKIEVPTQ